MFFPFATIVRVFILAGEMSFTNTSGPPVFINNRAPIPIKDLVTLNRNTTQINLRSHNNDPHKIRNPVSKCLISSNGFSSRGPIIWNDIPQDIQNVREKHIFKYKLKQHLLISYSNTISCNKDVRTDDTITNVHQGVRKGCKVRFIG